MKQVLQHLGTGQTTVADVPSPSATPGSLLIRTSASLISAGTERMLVDFGRGSLIDKVRQQPDKVAQVLDKMRTDGVGATLDMSVGKAVRCYDGALSDPPVNGRFKVLRLSDGVVPMHGPMTACTGRRPIPNSRSSSTRRKRRRS